MVGLCVSRIPHRLSPSDCAQRQTQGRDGPSEEMLFRSSLHARPTPIKTRLRRPARRRSSRPRSMPTACVGAREFSLGVPRRSPLVELTGIDELRTNRAALAFHRGHSGSSLLAEPFDIPTVESMELRTRESSAGQDALANPVPHGVLVYPETHRRFAHTQIARHIRIPTHMTIVQSNVDFVHRDLLNRLTRTRRPTENKTAAPCVSPFFTGPTLALAAPKTLETSPRNSRTMIARHPPTGMNSPHTSE